MARIPSTAVLICCTCPTSISTPWTLLLICSAHSTHKGIPRCYWNSACGELHWCLVPLGLQSFHQPQPAPQLSAGAVCHWGRCALLPSSPQLCLTSRLPLLQVSVIPGSGSGSYRTLDSPGCKLTCCFHQASSCPSRLRSGCWFFCSGSRGAFFFFFFVLQKYQCFK